MLLVPFYETLIESRKKGLWAMVYTLFLGIIFQFISLSVTRRQIAHMLLSSDFMLEINESKMILNINDKGLSKDLFIYGKREFLTTDYLINSGALKEGDVVLDIGANIGYYALLESRLVGNSGKVYAVEPVSTNFEILKKNIKLNNRKNMQVFHLAAGDKNTSLKVYLHRKLNLCSVIRNPSSDYVGEETVDCLTVDSFLEGKDTPQLIRMDVEGYEYNILKGMELTIKKPVKILMEIHGNIMTKEKSNVIFNVLRKNGFKVDFAAYDLGHVQHKMALNLVKKMGISTPMLLDVDWDKLQEWVVEKRMSALILFSNTHNY
ncbi:FkbM family methyltransferase [bacterium]|nr:MAG: FkbM family methyltransferase [bacterium]